MHYLRIGATEGRAPHPLFDPAWYLKTNPDVAASGMNPLAHYLAAGGVEGRAPHPQFSSKVYLARNPEVADSGINPLVHHVLSGARPQVQVPDLFELRTLNPRGRIAVVLHLYYAEFWDEMRQAIERIPEPFDLFVSLTKGASDHMRDQIKQAFPSAWVFDFENRGRDIGPFLLFVRSGVLFRYELVCKLHTKLSPYIRESDGRDYPNGNTWRRALIGGVLGSSQQIDQIVSSFRSDPDLGIVVADGNIYSGRERWTSNKEVLAELLPKIGIPPNVEDQSFPGGSIFWVRSFPLRTLAGLELRLDDFEPEPLQVDGGLAHAIERMFGLICEDAGMRVAEWSQLSKAVVYPRPGRSAKVDVIAYYLPQFHPIRENDEWWGPGFTEWANVTRARPLFQGHRQPRLPADLGFYDLRLAEAREAQAVLARRYGLAAFCYYYYWFDGRRVLERPLDEVLRSGEPDFPFMIHWANEPWTRNWDGLNRDVLLQQTYLPGWTTRFARDVAPFLRDRRYFRIDGKPMLLIYRIGHIPAVDAAIRDLRISLLEEGIPEVHLAAGWTEFPEDDKIPPDPRALGLDAYFEFPPHMLPSQLILPMPSSISQEFLGILYDYNRTVTAALGTLDDPIETRRHRAVMAGWDNTARTEARAHIFHGATPTSFRRWLRGTVVHERCEEGDRVVFVNAWNEWAEGTYLEPDRDFGCGWLEAVASATDVEWSKTQVSGA
jgi:lipopolysaccharide biosynthesis protein